MKKQFLLIFLISLKALVAKSQFVNYLIAVKWFRIFIFARNVSGLRESRANLMNKNLFS